MIWILTACSILIEPSELEEKLAAIADTDNGIDTADTDTDTDTDTAQPANEPPSAPTVIASPAEALVNQTDLTCQIDQESTDPEDDAITYHYQWIVPGGSVGAEDDSENLQDDLFTLPANIVQTTGNYTCLVTPNDGLQDGEAGSDTITVIEGDLECISLSLNDGPQDNKLVVPTLVSTNDDPITELTFETWIQLWDPSNSPYLFKNQCFAIHGCYNNQFIVEVDQDCDGELYDWQTSEGMDCGLLNGMDQNNWNNVTVTYDSNTGVAVYINGSPGPTSTMSSGQTNTTTAGGFGFVSNGQMDEHWTIQVANLRITAKMLYETQFTPESPFPQDEAEFLRYDFNLSNTDDQSGNNRHAILTGGGFVDGCPASNQSHQGCEGDCSFSITLPTNNLDFEYVPSGADPLTRYELSNPFYMMTTELAQSHYEDLSGETWKDGRTDFSVGLNNDLPVYYVTWDMAAEVANRATDAHNVQYSDNLDYCYQCTGSGVDVDCAIVSNPYDCRGYRLPTQAEWEYASRGGTSKMFWTGEGSSLGGDYSNDSCVPTPTINDGSNNPPLTDFAYFECNSNGSLSDVYHLSHNGFGLFGMHGNVIEWTNDYDCTNYPNGYINPWCNDISSMMVLKGGSLESTPDGLTNTFATTLDQSMRFQEVGFRLTRKYIE